jgi:hypothetical protein
MFRTVLIGVCVIVSTVAGGKAQAELVNQQEVCALEGELKVVEKGAVVAVNAEQNPIKRQMLSDQLNGLRALDAKKRAVLFGATWIYGGTRIGQFTNGFAELQGKLTSFDQQPLGFDLGVLLDCPTPGIVFQTSVVDPRNLFNGQKLQLWESDLSVLRAALAEANRGSGVSISGTLGRVPASSDRLDYGAQFTSIRKQ